MAEICHHRLACAKTIHKAQGSTLNDVVIDLGTRKQEHMHYVGLSRVRKLENLFISSLNEQKIALSAKVVKEMERLREDVVLRTCLPVLKHITSDLKIIYHNTRSLHCHMKDVANDENLKSGDIIAISESRLVPNDRDEDFLLPGFNMYRFDGHVANGGRPFNGMVLYSKKELHNPRKFILCGVDAVTASIDYRDASVNLLFIYCPINMASISNFCKF